MATKRKTTRKRASKKATASSKEKAAKLDSLQYSSGKIDDETLSKIEELAINNYFSKIFTKAILSSTNLTSGKVFEPGSGGGMASARLASLGFELTCMELSQNALRKSTSLFKSLSLDGKHILGDIFHILDLGLRFQ